jgi:hypothetical protein
MRTDPVPPKFSSIKYNQLTNKAASNPLKFIYVAIYTQMKNHHNSL